MALTLITPAAAPVVSLAQAKAWCRVEGGGSDALLGELLLAAQRHVEMVLGRSLGEQTWTLTLDGFSDAIELGKGPVTGIVADGFTYRDLAGVPQTVDPALYSLDLVSNPAWVVLNEGESWPDVLDAVNVVEISFTAGEGADLCPPDLGQAIKMLTAYWFDNRDLTGREPDGLQGLIQPYRRIRI